MLVLIVFIMLLLPQRIYNQSVCARNKLVTKTKLETYSVKYQEPLTYKCGFLWTQTCRSIFFYSEKCCRTESRVSKYQEYEKEEYCCDGYKRDLYSSSLKCIPHCSSACVHGTCVAPEKCSCQKGYKLHAGNEYVCHPACSTHCSNGKCIAPETCSCNKGYKQQIGNKYACDPVCSKQCFNGKCIAPETCSCNKGYKLNRKNTYICDPICSIPCSNGTCVAPETCFCEEGYELSKNNTYVCEPICSTLCYSLIYYHAILLVIILLGVASICVLLIHKIKKKKAMNDNQGIEETYEVAYFKDQFEDVNSTNIYSYVTVHNDFRGRFEDANSTNIYSYVTVDNDLRGQFEDANSTNMKYTYVIA